MNRLRPSSLSSSPSRSPAQPLAWLGLCVIWGSTWLAIKIGLQDLPPFLFAGVRFVVASATLFAACAVWRVPAWPRTAGDWPFLVGTGALTFFFNHGFLFWGEQFIPSGLAAVLQATIPGFGLLAAHWLLPAEPLTFRKVLGVLLGLAGVATVFAHQLHAGDQGRAAAWGSAAVVFAAASVAAGNVLVKRRGAHLAPAAMAAWQMAFGCLPLLAVGTWREGSPLALRWTPSAVTCLLYLAVVGSSVAFFLYYWLTARVPVTHVMTVALVTPVFAVVLGWLALGETLSWRTALGAAVVLAGTTLIVRPPARRRGRGRRGDRAVETARFPLADHPETQTP